MVPFLTNPEGSTTPLRSVPQCMRMNIFLNILQTETHIGDIVAVRPTDKLLGNSGESIRMIANRRCTVVSNPMLVGSEIKVAVWIHADPFATEGPDSQLETLLLPLKDIEVGGRLSHLVYVHACNGFFLPEAT